MTKEEAQIIIGNIPIKPEVLDDCYDITEYQEAKAMAIEALAQQPCENSISKTEVINAIHKTIYEFFDIADDDSEELINDKDKLLLTINKAISNAVKALPSVIPQRKIGKWVKHDTGHSIYYDCSLCGCVAPCIETADRFIWKLSNYCPDCGADMRQKEKY